MFRRKRTVSRRVSTRLYKRLSRKIFKRSVSRVKSRNKSSRAKDSFLRFVSELSPKFWRQLDKIDAYLKDKECDRKFYYYAYDEIDCESLLLDKIREAGIKKDFKKLEKLLLDIMARPQREEEQYARVRKLIFKGREAVLQKLSKKNRAIH